MLFDLKGKRRRLVQATYLMLAVLMGGGLVLFGIGGDVSGGLFDAFSERSGNTSNSSETFENRRDDAERALQANPRDEEALKALARANFQLASSQLREGSSAFPEDARDELVAAGRAWDRYIALGPDPIDDGLARLMVQVYGPGALNEPDKLVRTAELIARANETTQNYLLLVQYAALAGQTRTADLAGQRAIDLAPRDQRSDVKETVEQLKAAGAVQQVQGEGAEGSPPGG